MVEGISPETSVASKAYDFAHASDSTTGDAMRGQVVDLMKQFHGNGNNPSFTASETTDSFGRIQERKVSYEGDGLNFEVDKGNGDSQYLEKVKTVATVFNPITGNYDSTISLDNGIKYASVTDAQGRVIRFNQS